MDAAAGPKTVRVTIFHQQYSVSASDDNGEIETLAQEVDELMSAIAQRAGNVDSTRNRGNFHCCWTALSSEPRFD